MECEEEVGKRECEVSFFCLLRRKKLREASERRKKKKSERRRRGFADPSHAPVPHPAGRSDLFCLSTAARESVIIIELVRGGGEEGRAEESEERREEELSSSLSKLPKLRLSRVSERASDDDETVGRWRAPRGGVPASPTSALRRRGAREERMSRYVVNWRNARARETYLVERGEEEAKGEKKEKTWRKEKSVRREKREQEEVDFFLSFCLRGTAA